MITIIRNDSQARFAHDVYGIKIKEEKPMYKIIGTLNNEGICLYESPNYGEVANTFDIIIDAIQSGQKYVILHPPISGRALPKEDYDETDVYDFCKDPNSEDMPLDRDIYGRRINKDEEEFNDDYYAREESMNNFAWQDPRSKSLNISDNKYLDNFCGSTESYKDRKYLYQ